jgi:hypothetical protein
MTERKPAPEAFTVSMPEGGWTADLGSKKDEVEQACLDYLTRRGVRPGLAMHPDTYQLFLPQLFVYHPKLAKWDPWPPLRASPSHPRDTITFFDDPHSHGG